MAECPYCNKELDTVASCGEFVKRDYDHDFVVCIAYDEYKCECPHCGKTFRGFENYEYTGESTMRMDE